MKLTLYRVKRIVVVKKSLIIILSALTISTTTNANQLTYLPDDVIVRVTHFLPPEDAFKFTKTCSKVHKLLPKIKEGQLPNLYKAIGRDYLASIMSFDPPHWRPLNKMPPAVRGLIHDWYLSGRKVKDPFKRFCYLMAAGRAGHYYAAIEAGAMLNESSPINPLERDQVEGEVIYHGIPCVVTLEDLIRAVPELSFPVVQEWDICKLGEELIDDPIVNKIYDKYSKAVSEACDTLDDDLFIMKDPEKAKDRFIALAPIVRKQTSRAISQLDASSQTTDEVKVSKKLISQNQIFFLAVVPTVLIDGVKKMLKIIRRLDLTSDDIEEETRTQYTNFLQHAPHFIDYLRTVQEEEPDIQGFRLLNSQYSGIPLYWAFLGTYYAFTKQNSKQVEVLEKTIELRLNAESCGNMGDALTEACVALNNANMEKLLELAKAAKIHFWLSGLLGNTDSLDDLVDDYIDEEKAPHMLLKCAGEDLRKQREVFELLWNFLPLNAFILQLNAIRYPDRKDVYNAMLKFFESITIHPNTKYYKLNPLRAEVLEDFIDEMYKDMEENPIQAQDEIGSNSDD